MCSSRCVTTWEICTTTVVTELENGTQKQEERTKSGETLSPWYSPALAVTVLTARGCVLHCGCGYLHCACLMENTETWVNGIWKTWSKDSSDTPVGDRKVAVPILCRIRWEHLVTHMALLLSLADDIYHFTGLHLVDMSGYVLPCLASFTTHQTRAATRVCCAVAPPVPSVTEPQVHTALLSPSSLLVVLVLKTQHRLPGTLKTVGLPYTHIWKLWFICSVTCQHTNKQLFKTFSFVFNLKFMYCYNCPPTDLTRTL